MKTLYLSTDICAQTLPAVKAQVTAVVLQIKDKLSVFIFTVSGWDSVQNFNAMLFLRLLDNKSLTVNKEKLV